ncbi:MAG: hypothetical protein ACYTGZ_19490 [Planctomycetota bacterium]|jgi:hypothetical protein
MLRNIGAVIVGLIVGNVWNMALILLNAKVLYPMAEGADMQDEEQMKAYVASLPALAFVVVLAAHVGQGGIGGWIAARLGASRPMLLAGVIGALTVAGAAYNQVALEGPAWMWIDVPLIIAATWYAGRTEIERRAALG